MNDQSPRIREIADRDPTTGMHPVDIDALADGRHPDPFSQLGPHRTAAGTVIRALLPGASGVSVVSRASGKRIGKLTQIDARGLFAGLVERDEPYRLCIDWHGVEQEIEDTYSFGAVLSEEALARLARADPYAVLDCLGARPCTFEGIPGVRFAVWAPNARRVSVVGDFNTLDGRRHPMRLRHVAGVWE